MKLYSIKCKSLKIYNLPFPATDDGQAVNLVRNAVRQGNEKQLVTDIQDLSLFSVGVFDSKEGIKNTRPKLVTDLAAIPGIFDLVKEVVENVAAVSEA